MIPFGTAFNYTGCLCGSLLPVFHRGDGLLSRHRSPVSMATAFPLHRTQEAT